MFRRLIIITGASKGIGASASIEFYKRYPKNTEFILFARDLAKLNEVKNEMLGLTNCLNDEVERNRVHTIKIDFSDIKLKLNDYTSCIQNALGIDESNLSKFNELIVLYNHGTLDFGLIENAITLDTSILNEKFQTNFYSIWLLLNATQTLFPTNHINKQLHVNINSSFSTNAAANWSIQCCARSSRLMLFKCLALEKPSYRVLNYDPGIVYTDGAKLVYEENLFGEKFKQDYENGEFVSGEITMKNLIKILDENNYESGTSIRYGTYKIN